MKKHYIILSLFLAVISIYGQNTGDTSFDKTIMKQALLYGDNTVVANSLYNIIAKEGSKSVYKDSLAYLYFNARKFSSCYLVCSDILAQDGKKQDILEMQAVSLESLGAIDKAAQVYTKLVVMSNNNYHAYKLANLYFALKKYDEASKAIQKAQQLKDKGTIKVTYAINKNYNQQVSLLAAIYNLKGLIEFEQDKMDLAKISFKKALDLDPDFVMAKDNLQSALEGKSVKKEKE